MSTNRLIGIILLVVGAILLYFGFQSSESVVDQTSEALTGRFTDTTMWYLIGGAAAAIVGLVMVVKKR